MLEGLASARDPGEKYLAWSEVVTSQGSKAGEKSSRTRCTGGV